MKTTQKFLMLTILIGLVAFIFGSLAAIGDVPQSYPLGDNDTSISNTIAAIGAILIFLSAFAWLVKVTIKIFKNRSEGKDKHKAWSFYTCVILLPIEMSLALCFALAILADLRYVYECWFYAYEVIFYSFLGIVFSPAFCLFIGLGEVILFSIVIFNKKLTEKKV